MDLQKIKKRALLWWASITLLALLCVVLAALQFRWIAEVAAAEQSRLKNDLESRLELLRRNFEERIDLACLSFVPTASEFEKKGKEEAYLERYRRERTAQQDIVMFIALAVPKDNDVLLFVPDAQGNQLVQTRWPPGWGNLHTELLSRANGGPPALALPQIPTLRDVPHFGREEEGRLGRTIVREQNWLVLELNDASITRTLVPEMLNRYLSESGKLDYDADVVLNQAPFTQLYQSEAHKASYGGWTPDASVALLSETLPNQNAGPSNGIASFPRPPSNGSSGLWLLRVHHRAGSLETIVAAARRRNIALSAGLLVLIVATVISLMRSSRRERQTAELQMNFVEGVSHELRTPLTVIRTAAFNLRGDLGRKPEQVERYATLMQNESEKLTALVEQVLRYGTARSGRVIAQRSPVAVEALIEASLKSSRLDFEHAGLTIEKKIAPVLPMVLVDEEAMEHVVQNLVENAKKYGTENSNWIGISAAIGSGKNGATVEIRVVDRGPGIPKEERERIFDPFFRGRRAIDDQIHGTGLGLNLVKEIVEAHGGSIEVKCEPTGGTEFIVQIPAAPAEQQS